jgi:hypothetical protein
MGPRSGAPKGRDPSAQGEALGMADQNVNSPEGAVAGCE